jgi:hypothetical protein
MGVRFRRGDLGDLGLGQKRVGVQLGAAKALECVCRLELQRPLSASAALSILGARCPLLS